jgi:preprotein translocase subunit SecG
MLLNVLLGVQIVVCIVLVGVILLQRSEGGALGMGGGGGGGGGSFMSARGAGDLLTRVTAFAAFGFFALSLGLTLLSAGQGGSSITERLDVDAIDPSGFARPQPTAPATPGAPLPGGACRALRTPRPSCLEPLRRRACRSKLPRLRCAAPCPPARPSRPAAAPVAHDRLRPGSRSPRAGSPGSGRRHACSRPGHPCAGSRARHAGSDPARRARRPGRPTRNSAGGCGADHPVSGESGLS